MIMLKSKLKSSMQSYPNVQNAVLNTFIQKNLCSIFLITIHACCVVYNFKTHSRLPRLNIPYIRFRNNRKTAAAISTIGFESYDNIQDTSTSAIKYLIVSHVYFSDSTWQNSEVIPSTPAVFYFLPYTTEKYPV